MRAEENKPVIRYRIEPVDPHGHWFEVSCQLPDPDPAGQTFSLPAWIPGSYMIRDFARHVLDVRAHGAGRALALRKLDKQTWRCEPCDGILSLSYRVYAWDLSVRGAYLDQTRGFFNGTSVFVAFHGREQMPCEVDILAPEGAGFERWRVATSLSPQACDEAGFGRYGARDYAELIDHPVEMSDFTEIVFDVEGVPHRLVIAGRHQADTGRLQQDVARICRHHLRFFGEPLPIERYLFQVLAVGEGYGGLEHCNSTSLICRRDHLPHRGQSASDEGYREFLALCSHEYFHLWNVKRIRPERLLSPDLSREVHTELLWWFEGVTSYYDELALLRCGLIEAEAYLDMLAQTLTRVYRGQGRFHQSLAESSFDAWTKFYKQDENAPNAIVSYYSKGALVALALDLSLREHSGDTRSLDDVLRYLWQHYGVTGTGVPEKGLAAIIRQATDVDVDDFLAQAVHGVDDLPLAELLRDVGVEMRLRAATGQDDKGGSTRGRPPAAALGARWRDHPQGVELTHVLGGMAAQQAGLAAGDVIIAWNGLRATGKSLETALACSRAGESVVVHAFRRDELMCFDVALQEPPQDTCELRLMDELEETALRRRRAWLGA